MSANDQPAILAFNTFARAIGREHDVRGVFEPGESWTANDREAVDEISTELIDAWIDLRRRHDLEPRSSDEECREHAQQLVTALTERGVKARLHWDRGPYCAQIFLTDDDAEFAPALFVGTEGKEDIAHATIDGKRTAMNAYLWIGQLGGFEPEMYDVVLHMNERPWLGEGIEAIADELVPFVRLLKVGTAEFTGTITA